MTRALADDIVLVETLRLVVPMRISELLCIADDAWRVDVMRRWAAAASEVVASNGDSLMFRTNPWRLKDSHLAPGHPIPTSAGYTTYLSIDTRYDPCGHVVLEHAPTEGGPR
jgi:hypothetical protein